MPKIHLVALSALTLLSAPTALAEEGALTETLEFRSWQGHTTPAETEVVDGVTVETRPARTTYSVDPVARPTVLQRVCLDFQQREFRAMMQDPEKARIVREAAGITRVRYVLVDDPLRVAGALPFGEQIDLREPGVLKIRVRNPGCHRVTADQIHAAVVNKPPFDDVLRALYGPRPADENRQASNDAIKPAAPVLQAPERLHCTGDQGSCSVVSDAI